MFDKLFSPSFLKIIKCGGADDGVTLRCQDSGDTMGIVIENAGMLSGDWLHGVWPNLYTAYSYSGTPLYSAHGDPTGLLQLYLLELHLSLQIRTRLPHLS